MNYLSRVLFLMMALMAAVPLAQAEYKEVMDPKGFSKNLKKHYRLKDDNAQTDQSDKLREAIDDVSKHGGGTIVIPKGVYRFSSIYLKSNVHLLIDAGTVIKPSEGVVFSLTPGREEEKANNRAFIENVSIRGVGGSFIIDYHDRKYKDRQRAITAQMVRNFLISDMIVKDNYSVYCGISFSPSREKKEDVSGWEVSRPTDGTVQNITHLKASPGYGLVQCHGARSVHFENLYSLGGVAFRLEVGADNKNVGVYDLTAQNITCKNGKAAVLLGPHSAKNGVVTIDGVTAISCEKAVGIGAGHVKEHAPDQTPGWFGEGSSVKNIHAVFGTSAQIKRSEFLRIPDPKYYADMEMWCDHKFYTGPSIGAVLNSATSYTAKIENVTMEGFEYNHDKPVMKDGDGYRPGKWADEKAMWEKTHQGGQWLSDKGVVVTDYDVNDYMQ